MKKRLVNHWGTIFSIKIGKIEIDFEKKTNSKLDFFKILKGFAKIDFLDHIKYPRFVKLSEEGGSSVAQQSGALCTGSKDWRI